MPVRFKRILLIILDSLGVGELPDAFEYGDQGAATLQHIAEAVNGLHLPNLQQMGMGNIVTIKGLSKTENPNAFFGKMREKSKGKDTTTGHWEIMGINLKKPFPTYPKGFPPEIIKPFEKKIGKKVLGNCVASGTEIINILGEEHMKTGSPIVYTSADSVFQIAAHKSVCPLEKLYEICLFTRELLKPPHEVCRIIARPFIGKPGSFTRTDDRQDYSLPPPEGTYLDKLKNAGCQVVGIGKVENIFAGRGLTQSHHTRGNNSSMLKILELMDMGKEGLIFANLIDFDMLYGHRNDPKGYALALEQFDRWLVDLLKKITDDDLLIISADHGNDPTFPGTDHNREYVPLLVYNPQSKNCGDLGTRQTFADLGTTVADNFGILLSNKSNQEFMTPGLVGTSFLDCLS